MKNKSVNPNNGMEYNIPKNLNDSVNIDNFLNQILNLSPKNKQALIINNLSLLLFCEKLKQVMKYANYKLVCVEI